MALCYDIEFILIVKNSLAVFHIIFYNTPITIFHMVTRESGLCFTILQARLGALNTFGRNKSKKVPKELFRKILRFFGKTWPKNAIKPDFGVRFP